MLAVPTSMLVLATGAAVGMDLCGVGREPRDARPTCPLGRVPNTEYEPPRCQDPGSVAQYGPCSEQVLCQGGLVCDATEQICLADAQAGDACSADADCGLMWCNAGYFPPQCQPAGEAGAVCGSKKDCLPELLCSAFHCVVP